MIRYDYLQEIGAEPVEKKIPWPYALVILAALFAGVGWYASVELRSHRSPAHPIERSTVATHNAAPSSPQAESPTTVKKGASNHGVG